MEKEHDDSENKYNGRTISAACWLSAGGALLVAGILPYVKGVMIAVGIACIVIAIIRCVTKVMEGDDDL